MNQSQIEQGLHKALLQEGKMERTLYELTLEEHIDYWYEGLLEDDNAFVFAVVEEEGDVAMVLIMPDKTVYANEEARAKLLEFWPKTYHTNMQLLIPTMAEELVDGIIAVNGVSVV